MVNKPNYKKAEHIAYELLSGYTKPTIPVDVFNIATGYENLRVKPYSWFAELHRISVEEVKAFARSDSGCCYYNVKTGTYLILYNDAVRSGGHIRWTLGHELGHYLLRHNEQCDEAIISRNTITKSQYQTYEKEANCFARSLLAPPNLIAVLGITQDSSIADVFDLSPPAAKNVISFLSESKAMGISYVRDCALTKNFSTVIKRFLNLKHCTICGSEYDKSFAFCPVCGKARSDNAGADYVIYPSIALRKDGRVQECPNCKNEEHIAGADFCMICGDPVVNRCTRALAEGDVPYEYRECSRIEPLPGNARFCPYCGSKTVFFETGLLKAWDHKEPEFTELSDDDGDLPF